jgi:uncharacterized protein
VNRKASGMLEGIAPHWQFYFTVDVIEAAQKRVIDAGGKVVVPLMDVPEAHAFCKPKTIRRGDFAVIQGPNRNPMYFA